MRYSDQFKLQQIGEEMGNKFLKELLLHAQSDRKFRSKKMFCNIQNVVLVSGYIEAIPSHIFNGGFECFI